MIVRETSRGTSDGHDRDTMYPTKCKIVSRSISLRSPTTFNHAIRQHYCQYRYSHKEMFTLASNSFRTQVLQRLLFRLLRYLPITPAIQNFLRRNFTLWNYNTVQPQGLTSTVCGQYCCLFTCTWTEGTPQNISSAFSLRISPMGRLTKSLHLNSDLYAKNCAVVNAATCIKGTPLLINLSLLLLLSI